MVKWFLLLLLLGFQVQGQNENGPQDTVITDEHSQQVFQNIEPKVSFPGSESSQTDEAANLYADAIGILESLAPKNLIKSNRQNTKAYGAATEQNQLEQMEDLLNDLVGLIGRLFYSRVSWIRNLFTFTLHTPVHFKPETDSHVDFDNENQMIRDGNIDIPLIEESDSPALKRAKAVKWLYVAAFQMDSLPALKTLGDMYLFSEFGHQRNATAAFQFYLALATKGDPHGQFIVGKMYATGVGIQRNYPKALVYMTFSSLGNYLLAHQTLGYWHAVGITMPKDCESAGWHYSVVASAGVEQFRDGPLGGRVFPEHPLRLFEKEGGIFGEGASGSESHGKRKTNAGILSNDDILTFYRLQAETGDPYAQLITAQLYYQGTDTTEKDYSKALKFFERAANQHPGMAAINSADVSQTTLQAARSAAKAAGFLGVMHSRGEGVEVDLVKARMWYERGVAQDGAASFTGLGVMYMKGLGGLPKDEAKGVKLFEQGVAHDNADAMVYLAEHLMKAPRVDLTQVTKLLNKAAQTSNLLAYYHMGRMFLKGQGVVTNCKFALTYLKTVSERANWKDTALSDAEEALERGDRETAFLHYLFAAERGYEVAQANAAWMLDRGMYTPSTSLLWMDEKLADPYEFAMHLWNRASNQGNDDARVKIGDYFYYGLGMKGLPSTHRDDADEESFETVYKPSLIERLLGVTFIFDKARVSRPSYERAATYYQVAAETEYSSIAMYNLGYMHEHGLGAIKDLHLAKRWYDMALSTNPSAFIAVHIALSGLMIKWGVAYILGVIGFKSIGVDEADTLTTHHSVVDEAPLPPPSSSSHTEEVEMDDNLVSGNLFAILLFLAATGLMFWRNRLEHQHRAEEAAAAQQAARLAENQNVPAAAHTAMEHTQQATAFPEELSSAPKMTRETRNVSAQSTSKSGMEHTLPVASGSESAQPSDSTSIESNMNHQSASVDYSLNSTRSAFLKAAELRKRVVEHQQVDDQSKHTKGTDESDHNE
ncbi:ERAD-associated protein [Batrachochytrium dendrobatidis]|nr:ERAD-associated protein [Batrachochytrium dendrobatidis]